MKINYLAPINPTSYGLLSSYFLKSLVQLGHKAALFPIGNPQPAYEEFVPFIQLALENAKFFDPNALSFRIFHQFDMAESVGKPRVGYTLFELDRLKDQELHHLSTLDTVVSPTRWQKEIIDKSVKGVKSFVAPLGVDTSVFKPLPLDKTNRPFTFIVIGKYEERKNYTNLFKCFDRAFAPHHDVEMVVICHSVLPNLQKRIDQQLMQQMNNTALAHKIKILPPNFMPVDQIVKIINVADCFVSYSRAEGFDLPLLESASCGKNVIATYVTGHTEYLDEAEGECKHGWLIKSKRMISANDGIFFDGFGEWHDFDNDDMIEAMRFAYENWQNKVNQYNVQRASEYTWDKSSKRLTDALQNV